MTDWRERRVKACEGQCCATIWLGAGAVNVLSGDERSSELNILREMLVPRVEQENPEVGIEFDCSNWNAKDGRCLAYDSRPVMCAAYPYGDSCNFCGLKGRACGKPLFVAAGGDPE